MGFEGQKEAPKRQRSCIGCASKEANKQGKLARGLKCSIEASDYQRVHDELQQYIAERSQQ